MEKHDKYVVVFFFSLSLFLFICKWMDLGMTRTLSTIWLLSPIWIPIAFVLSILIVIALVILFMWGLFSILGASRASKLASNIKPDQDPLF